MLETEVASERVLLVDDDAELGDYAAVSLERRSGSFSVVTERSADDGLERLDEEEFDCIVSDYAMPGMDGLEFLDRVREEYPEMPFILLTGQGSEDVASEAISRGVTDYLKKTGGSSQYAVLANRIENVVEQHRFRKRVDSQYQAMEAAMDGMAILDDEETYQYVNEAHAEIYGYDDPSELVGESWEMLYDDIELERIRREVMTEFRETGQWRGEAVGQRKDGTTFPQEVSLSTLDDGRTVCVVRDITSRKQREEALEESNRHLEAILDTTSAAVFLKDLDGRYVLMNQECRELLGVEDGLVGVTDHDLFPEEIADEYLADDRRVLEAGETIAIEEEVPTAEGPRMYRTLKSPVFNDDGEPYGVCGVSTDISDQKEYERQLRRQNEQWETFASVVSQDLENPLSVATEELETARERCESSCEAENLAAIADALGRMEAIVGDTLTLARQGRRVAGLERVTLGELAEEGWEAADADGSTLRVESDGTFDADPDRLQHVFENLLQNAVVHNDGNVTVRVGTLDDEPGFYVEDDGSGLPPGAREEVFEPDFSTAEEGTGLGLVIARRIVEAHGWKITAGTSDTGGARFEISKVRDA